VLGLPLVPDAENKNKISRRLPAFRLLGWQLTGGSGNNYNTQINDGGGCCFGVTD